MTRSIAGYALLGDMRTAALVGRDGSIDWWCAPRFDSGAAFARLLGDDDNGFWRLAPTKHAHVTRAYAGSSLVLETTYRSAVGAVTVSDALVVGSEWPVLVRTVECLAGSVEMRSSLHPRMYYGRIVPWTRSREGAWCALAAPDALLVRADVPLGGDHGASEAEFVLEAGRRVTFTLQWFPAHDPEPAPADGPACAAATLRWWHDWAGTIHYDGYRRDAVLRSALTLKALTDCSTGALVAAATTSLPEHIGGDRNWDYRFCWIRDAAFAFSALSRVGARDELFAWLDWFFRVYAGEPATLDIMYGVGGERLTPEEPVSWLAGYRGSRPVRIGNDAHGQLQLGILGDLTMAIAAAQDAGWEIDGERWSALRPLVAYLERMWQKPGNGIWELRGERRQYVHSKGMAACAARHLARLAAPFDAACASAADALAARIAADVAEHGYDRERGAFVESYGSDALDASVLLLPLRGFLPAGDPRMVSTVAALERELMLDGYVFRYSPDIVRHGSTVETREGAFTACGFWLVQVLVAQGRRSDAEALFERLLQTANDVGIFSEGYDVRARVAVGNTPQAFSHAGLIEAALALVP